MAIETTYKTYTLRMNEDDETWSCFELEISACASLKACKAAIDKLSQKDRRIDVKALMLRGGGRFHDKATVVEVMVSLLCAATKDYGRGAGESIKQCWIVKKGERVKVSIDNLYPIGSRDDLERWLALEERAQEAQRVANTHKEAIGAFTPDTLVLASKEAHAAKAEAS